MEEDTTVRVCTTDLEQPREREPRTRDKTRPNQPRERCPEGIVTLQPETTLQKLNRIMATIPLGGRRQTIWSKRRHKPNNNNIEPKQEDAGTWFTPFTNDYNGKTPIFRVELKGRTKNCLLDTGAGVNLIGGKTLQTVWPEYKRHLKPTKTRACDVREQPLTLEGKVDLELRFGDKPHIMTFEVISHADTLILGNPFLYNRDLVVIAREGFGTRDAVPPITRRPRPTKYKVYAVKDTLLEKGNYATVQVTTNTGKRTWGQDINRSFLLGDQNTGGHEMSPTLSAMDHKGELITIVNGQDNTCDITISAGTCLGEATSNYEDGEQIVAAVMAELADIQKDMDREEKVRHISTEQITNPDNTWDGADMDVDPPGFDMDGPQPGRIKASQIYGTSNYDTQRENKGETAETAEIHMEDPEEREKIREILKKHSKMFSRHNYDIGHFMINGEVQKVKLSLSDKTPITERYRTISPAKREAAEMILQELEKNKIITRKASAWASQCVWVTKAQAELDPQRAKELNLDFIPGMKDPTSKRNLRFCQDYRQLNNRLQQVQWPLPGVKDLLSRLRGTKYVSVLDASHSFYSIELDEESKLFTGFQSCEKNFVMNRLAMGLKCSSGILNACLARTLQGLEAFTVPYSDNILVMSSSKKEHTKHLARVLAALEEHNWKFKMAKCHWAVSDTLRIFGMQVDLKRGKIGPDPTKMKAIRELTQPATRKALKSFLGGIGYFVECIPDIGKAISTLHELTKPSTQKGDKIQWTPEGTGAFAEIITKLQDANEIAMPDWSKPFHLVVDAGPQHTSAMLTQLDAEDKWTPLGFFNKKLSERECKLSQVEREALAVVYGLRQTSFYVSHAKVFIHSDNKPFVMLQKYASQNAKLSRWKLFLESFDHFLVWESSTSPAISFVDFMSRPPSKKLVNRTIKEQDIQDLPNKIPDGIYNPQQYGKMLEEILSKQDQSTEGMTTIATAAEMVTPDLNGTTSNRIQERIATRIAMLSANEVTTRGGSKRKTITNRQTGTPEESLMELVVTDCPHLDITELQKLQKECSTLGPIYKNVEKHPRFLKHKGTLLQKFEVGGIQRILLAVPICLADDLIGDIHRGTSTNHAGRKKLTQMIKTRYFIPQLIRRTAKIVQQCGLCHYYKPRRIPGRRPDAKKMVARGPGDIWAADHIQITSRPDEKDRTSLICFVDLYSHFLICRAVPKTLTAEQVADIFLTDVVARFGVPRALLTDNGSDMDSDLIRETSNLLGIRKLTISAGSPRSNGIVEKIQGLVLGAIRHQAAQYKVRPDQFADLAIWAALAHNSTPFQDLSPPLSPSEIFLGRSIAESSFFGFANAAYSYRNLEEFNKKMTAAQMTIAEIVGAKTRYLAELKMKQGILSKGMRDFPEGTLVALKDKTQSRKDTNVKLRPRYRGVFTVVKQTETSCLIRAYSSETILEDVETEEEITRGRGRRLPRYRIIKADKDDLKKIRHLVFYSQPMAKKFMEHLVSKGPNINREYETEPEEDQDQFLEAEEEGPKDKRSAEDTLEQPIAKVAKMQEEHGHEFPFEEDLEMEWEGYEIVNP